MMCWVIVVYAAASVTFLKRRHACLAPTNVNLGGGGSLQAANFVFVERDTRRSPLRDTHAVWTNIHTPKFGVRTS